MLSILSTPRSLLGPGLETSLFEQTLYQDLNSTGVLPISK